MKVYLFLIPSFLILFAACNNKMEDKKSHKEVNAIYKEAHRPQFHFSPKEKWMNDPNGMFFYEGEYHLFYQYYPDSTVWGPMHWGHAISKDLVHWKHLDQLFNYSLMKTSMSRVTVIWLRSGCNQMKHRISLIYLSA